MQHRKWLACLVSASGVMALSACGGGPSAPDHVVVNESPALSQGTTGSAASNSSAPAAPAASVQMCGKHTVRYSGPNNLVANQEDVYATLCVKDGGNVWAVVVNKEQTDLEYVSLPPFSTDGTATNLEVQIPNEPPAKWQVFFLTDPDPKHPSCGQILDSQMSEDGIYKLSFSAITAQGDSKGCATIKANIVQ